MNDNSYKEWNTMSDKSLMQAIGNFIQSNRLKQNKTQEQIATDAGISRSTLGLLEKGENIQLDSLIKVLRILNLLYIMDVFTVQEQISPIEYAKAKLKQRKQASPQKNNNITNNDLEW